MILQLYILRQLALAVGMAVGGLIFIVIPGIAVNAIAPGLTLVEATATVPEERHRHYVDGRAMPREQQPDDVVGPVLFLLSDAAGFVTGQLLPVNGGFVFN